MKAYFLNDYHLTGCQKFQSLFISEYGLRHLALAKVQVENRWGHRIIAIIQLCPLGIGLLATIIEAIVVKFMGSPVRDIKWLFKGNQTGCYGWVTLPKVEAVRAQLEAKNPQGIQFNERTIASYLEGGACTALALEFLSKYFHEKSSAKPSLVGRVVQLGAQFTSCSDELRHRQAAFNTIEVTNRNDNTIDHSKNKIQALANFHSLTIDYSSQEIDTENLNDATAIPNTLPQGAYLLRILKPANNEKLEESGHSLVYIKENDLSLFYDPNDGGRKLSPSEHTTVLFDSFKKNLRLFQVSKARFYRLQP